MGRVHMVPGISEKLRVAYAAAREELLSLRKPEGWWEGELSSSALSTAVAASALSMLDREGHARLIAGALEWLAADQNPDGGWGDTPDSPSNLSTTMLARAALQFGGGEDKYPRSVEEAERCITRLAGATRPERADAIEALYAPDRTFAVPILCNLALAGLADWERIPLLPFELAAFPRAFFSSLRLHVVSYALPALIAVGQLLHAKGRRGNLFSRIIRSVLTSSTLRKLEKLQPESGGFIEAIPLTSFVVMSLAGAGRVEHPVARRGAEFLINSRRADGSWPIDSNLSVWMTTGAVAALSGAGAYSGPDGEAVRQWLLEQQHTSVHPYTGTRQGGWSWTHLSGGVPDADDTAGALVALRALKGDSENGDVQQAADAGVRWLLKLQNSNGGWPTFCRGWGKLPFDKSAPDLTAHAMRAIGRWAEHSRPRPVKRALARGFEYLKASQHADGSWMPLWFGSQLTEGQQNPVVGTARVLAGYRDLGAADLEPARRGVEFLRTARNADGGWGAAPGVSSSVEETALAVEALSSEADGPAREAALCGGRFLAECVEAGRLGSPLPIGLYFAKLWYSECCIQSSGPSGRSGALS